MLGIIIMITFTLKWNVKNWRLKKLMNLLIVICLNKYLMSSYYLSGIVQSAKKVVVIHKVLSL